MVIIFYDAEKEQIYLCTERDKMKVLSIDDPGLKDHIPNDDILYVQKAHFITKKQFGEWLEGTGPSLDDELHRFTGFMDDDVTPYSETAEAMHDAATKYEHSKFIHPTHNGAIYIADFKTPKFPNGIELIGKYDFLCVDDVGGFESLEESLHYRTLLAKGKIEVVDYKYVKQHYGKKKSTSLADAELDKILIKGDARGTAEAVALAGGIDAAAGESAAGDVIPTILVESTNGL